MHQSLLLNTVHIVPINSTIFSDEIGEEAVDPICSSVGANKLVMEYVDSIEPENDPKCKFY